MLSVSEKCTLRDLCAFFLVTGTHAAILLLVWRNAAFLATYLSRQHSRSGGSTSREIGVKKRAYAP